MYVIFEILDKRIQSNIDRDGGLSVTGLKVLNQNVNLMKGGGNSLEILFSRILFE